MICAHSFMKDLEEIIKEAHCISNEFQIEICQAKCQIWNLIHQQIQNFKSRKKLDFAHSSPNDSTVYFSFRDQVNASTETCEFISLSEEISYYNAKTEINTDANLKNRSKSSDKFGKHVARGDAEFGKHLVTRSVHTTPEIDTQDAEPTLSKIGAQNAEHTPSKIGAQDAEHTPSEINPKYAKRAPPKITAQDVSEPEQNLGSNTETNRFRRLFSWFSFSTRVKKIFLAIVIGFLVWVALVYGVLLGVSICANGSCFFTSSRRSAVF